MLFASDFGGLIPWWIHAIEIVGLVLVLLAIAAGVITLAIVCLTFLVSRWSPRQEPEDENQEKRTEI
jgi:hypothetical protein